MTDEENALEKINECIKIVNEQLALAKQIADTFNLVLDVSLNTGTKQIEQEQSWQSSGINC